MGADPRIGELAERLRRVTEEVQAIGRAFDALLAWTRYCPHCGRPLEKTDPRDVVRCPCGWTWG